MAGHICGHTLGLPDLGCRKPDDHDRVSEITEQSKQLNRQGDNPFSEFRWHVRGKHKFALPHRLNW